MALSRSSPKETTSSTLSPQENLKFSGPRRHFRVVERLLLLRYVPKGPCFIIPFPCNALLNSVTCREQSQGKSGKRGLETIEVEGTTSLYSGVQLNSCSPSYVGSRVWQLWTYISPTSITTTLYQCLKAEFRPNTSTVGKLPNTFIWGGMTYTAPKERKIFLCQLSTID